MNIRIKITLPENGVTGLHLSADSVGLYANIYTSLFIRYTDNIRGGLRKRMRFETECLMAVQGHARSLILAPIESAHATSY